jgi:hypothetical protein
MVSFELFMVRFELCKIRFELSKVRFEPGLQALTIYHIASRLTRNTNKTHFAGHVENIRAELRRLRIGRPTKSRRVAKVTTPNGEEGTEGE